MVKICFVSINAWSIYNFRRDVVLHLIRKGHEVLVLAADDEYAALLQQDGCSFIAIDFDNRTENPFSDYLLYRVLKKIYQQHRPDIIFHYVIKPNIYGSLAAAACNIPSVAVITGLGYVFSKHNWLFVLIKRMYKHALVKAGEVWFLNNEDAMYFIGQRLVSANKTRVLHGEGINTHYFSPAGQRVENGNKVFRFLMSTRLLKSKGIAIYADAARILKKKNYQANFELIGFYENHPDSISPEDILRWQAEGLITYHGFARDVRIFLSKADCFVFPSFYNEGVPRCLMEAASMALPVITSKNRGCKEVVQDNETGFLCDMNNPFDLADKMEQMLKLSGAERIKMGNKGRLLVSEKFNVERIIGVYDQAIALQEAR